MSCRHLLPDKNEIKGETRNDGFTVSGYIYGERLEDIRKGHGLTIKAMAASVKVSPQTWRNYELDRTFPSMDTIYALCGVYHVNEEWLSSGSGEMYLDGYRPGDPLGKAMDYKEKILQELQERKGTQNLVFRISWPCPESIRSGNRWIWSWTACRRPGRPCTIWKKS